jgi:hypothetical protein
MRSQKASSVDCSLTVRDRFFDFLPNKDVARSASIQNIVNSGYVLLASAATATIRFACLKPVLVAGDCILPFAFFDRSPIAFPDRAAQTVARPSPDCRRALFPALRCSVARAAIQLHRLYLDWLRAH